MPDFNITKCNDYNSFLNVLNEIKHDIASSKRHIETSKVEAWLKNNSSHLQKGYDSTDESVNTFKASLQSLASDGDAKALQILHTFQNCLEVSDKTDDVDQNSIGEAAKHALDESPHLKSIIPPNFMGKAAKRALDESSNIKPLDPPKE